MFDSLRDELLKRDLSNTENYDKAILTLSSSSLGLSLTAIKFVIPISAAIYVPLLKASWALLVVSVISSLIAYIISNKAISIQLDNARDYYKNGIEDAFSKKNIFITLNSFLNKLTGLCFAVSIALIVSFISINIDKEEVTMTKKKTETVDVIKSTNVPTMERIPTDSSLGKNSANIPTMEQAPSSSDNSSQASSSDSSE